MVARTAKAKKTATPKKVAAPKPSVELYGWKSQHTGPSTEVNKNLSRTKVDPTKFNAFPKGNVTARDQAAIVALRKQFGTKSFARLNVDAGILRRLMERGLVNAVDPAEVNAPQAQYQLTKAGIGKA